MLKSVDMVRCVHLGRYTVVLYQYVDFVCRSYPYVSDTRGQLLVSQQIEPLQAVASAVLLVSHRPEAFTAELSIPQTLTHDGIVRGHPTR